MYIISYLRILSNTFWLYSSFFSQLFWITTTFLSLQILFHFFSIRTNFYCINLLVYAALLLDVDNLWEVRLSGKSNHSSMNSQKLLIASLVMVVLGVQHSPMLGLTQTLGMLLQFPWIHIYSYPTVSRRQCLI